MQELYKDDFSTYNPITNVVFFLGAIIMGMFFLHPAYVAVSILIGVIYLIFLKKKKALRELLLMLVMFIVLSAINPIFDRLGATVLFWLFGKPYTLEALIYGMTLGGMAVAILCWFACYNAIMSSDKFIYIFGRIIPAVSLILSMILRLIPNLSRKTRQIAAARSCIGKAGSSSASRMEKIRNGTMILSTLTSWALEGGIITADSMRSRGYGSGKRTTFAKYRFDGRNIILVLLMSLLIALTIFCAAKGGTKAEFVPFFTMTWFGEPAMLFGLLSYAIFLIIPLFLNCKETVKWRILRSKI